MAPVVSDWLCGSTHNLNSPLLIDWSTFAQTQHYPRMLASFNYMPSS